MELICVTIARTTTGLTPRITTALVSRLNCKFISNKPPEKSHRPVFGACAVILYLADQPPLGRPNFALLNFAFG